MLQMCWRKAGRMEGRFLKVEVEVDEVVEERPQEQSTEGQRLN